MLVGTTHPSPLHTAPCHQAIASQTSSPATPEPHRTPLQVPLRLLMLPLRRLPPVHCQVHGGRPTTHLEVCMYSKGPSSDGPRERPLKARCPDSYYDKSHMECYHFCQQCQDHFDNAGARGANRTPFAASFLRGRISFQWHQHKRRQDALVPLSWTDFKTFLRKNLGDSRAFVDGIWSRV